MGKLERAVNIADLRGIARARLPRVVFDYLDGGAEDERTLRDNIRAFRRWNFRPQQGVKIPAPNLSVTVMGQTLAWPAMTAPIGYSALMHRDGETDLTVGTVHDPEGLDGGLQVITLGGHVIEAPEHQRSHQRHLGRRVDGVPARAP